MKKIFFFFAVTIAVVAKSQELARRPFLGISMETVTEDIKRVKNLPSVNGVLINNVIAGSSAEAAGMKKGDVLLEINSVKLNSAEQTTKFVVSSKSGEPMNYELLRNGKKIKGKAVFKPYPTENYKDICVEYNAVKTVNGVQRLVVSKPKIAKEKMPAIIFIGGIGCYSLDNPFDTTLSETQLLNKLSRSGYVCVRAEKPGVGDNIKCTPCASVSFKDEVLGYVSAVEAVKKYKDVDSSKVFIIGHSMGGVMAPLVAQETKLRGIIAYGTIGSNFIEYLLKTRRTIGQAYQWKNSETDQYVRDCAECSGYYFVEKMTTTEAAKKKEICGEYLSVFDYRSRKYNDELYDLNIPDAWSKFNGEALLLWGAADYIASKEDHEIITETVNAEHPGKAKFEVVSSSTHGMQNARNFQEARISPGKYNPEVAGVILKWLNSIS